MCLPEVMKDIITSALIQFFFGPAKFSHLELTNFNLALPLSNKNLKKLFYIHTYIWYS